MSKTARLLLHQKVSKKLYNQYVVEGGEVIAAFKTVPELLQWLHANEYDTLLVLDDECCWRLTCFERVASDAFTEKPENG